MHTQTQQDSKVAKVFISLNMSKEYTKPCAMLLIIRKIQSKPESDTISHPFGYVFLHMCLEKKTSKKRSESRHLSSSWRNWNPFILLVRMPAGAVVVKNGMAITQNLITELQYSSRKK